MYYIAMLHILHTILLNFFALFSHNLLKKLSQISQQRAEKSPSKFIISSITGHPSSLTEVSHVVPPSGIDCVRLTVAGGWWLVLIYYERKILLAGWCWWLVLVCLDADEVIADELRPLE